MRNAEWRNGEIEKGERRNGDMEKGDIEKGEKATNKRFKAGVFCLKIDKAAVLINVELIFRRFIPCKSERYSGQSNIRRML